jgi:hypothetical protein
LVLDAITLTADKTCCSLPDNAYANDTSLATVCEPARFFLSPDDDGFVYECAIAKQGYKYLSAEPYDVPDGYRLFHLGYAHNALVYPVNSGDAAMAQLPWAIRHEDGSLATIAGTEEFPAPFDQHLLGPRALPDGFLIVKQDELWKIAFDGGLTMLGKYEMTFVDRGPVTADLEGEFPPGIHFKTQSGKQVEGKGGDCGMDKICNYLVESDIRSCGLEPQGTLLCSGGWYGHDGGLSWDYTVLLEGRLGETFRILSPEFLVDPSYVDDSRKPKNSGTIDQTKVRLSWGMVFTGP